MNQIELDPGTMSEKVRQCPIGEKCLNDRQLAAIDLLILGKSLGSVARTLSIDVRTLYRWRQDEDFMQALYDRRREVWEESADRLRDMVAPALDVVEAQLCDPYDRARFRAAATVLRLVDLKKAMQNEA